MITRVIHSFKADSAAGPDRLSPQHLKELISHLIDEAGSQLLEALAYLANYDVALEDPCCFLSISIWS